MKTRNFFGLMLGCIAAFCFISCSDDDNEVDFSQLKGIWAVTEPVLEDDYVTTYTFNTDNHTCSIYTGSPLSNGVALVCTYHISKDGRSITFRNDERQHTEKYQILKQTSCEMEWKNITPEDGNPDKRLTKIPE